MILLIDILHQKYPCICSDVAESAMLTLTELGPLRNQGKSTPRINVEFVYGYLRLQIDYQTAIQTAIQQKPILNAIAPHFSTSLF